MLRDSILVLLGIGIVLATEAAWVLWHSGRFVQRVFGRKRVLTWARAYWLGIVVVGLLAVLVVATIGVAIWYGLR